MLYCGKNLLTKIIRDGHFYTPLAVVSVRGFGAAASDLAAVLIRGAVRLVVERVKASAPGLLGAPSRWPAFTPQGLCAVGA